MIIPQKVGLSGFGGMGDMYKWYCLQSHIRGWGYLQSLKEKYPQTKVMALICSTNPHAVDIFTHNPYIDIVEYYAWPINNQGNLLQPGQLRLAQMLNSKGYPLMNIPNMQRLGIKPKECIIHLSKTDRDELEELTNEIGPYIVVHPFASVPERQTVSPEQYTQLIDKLIEKFNCDVIILGKSYKRSFSSGKGLTSYNKEETIETTNPRAFNLVNKTNTRVAITITENAKGFVGALSSFCAIAATKQIKTVVLSNNEFHKIAQVEIRRLWTKNNNFSIINTDTQTWDETMDQSCLYLQGIF